MIVRRRLAQRVAAPAAGAAVLAASLVCVPDLAAAPAAALPLTGRSYLVLPFENVAEDASLEWLSTGLALAIGEYARGWGARVVDEDERAVFLEAHGVPSGETLTLASVLELGRRMRQRPGTVRPDRVVMGRFDVEEGRINVEARTLDLGTTKVRPWIARAGRARDLIPILQDLAIALAADAGAAIQPQDPSLAMQAGDLPLLAFESYGRAMAEPDTKRRLQLLRRAAQEYPGYPKALYQAAALLAREERWSEAADALAQAKAMPHPYEPEALLLSAGLALQRGDDQTALDESRRALQYGESARAHLIAARALIGLGDDARATKEIDLARAIDPDDPEIEEVHRSLQAQAETSKRRSP